MKLILINGNFVTMNSSNPNVEAVSIKNGVFIKVGTNKEVLSLRESDTKVIDLKGKTVVPGFNDSHMHLALYGANLQECNLVGTTSIDELIERTRNFINVNNIKEGEWVIGRGWNQDYFDIREFPNRYDLDKISTSNPIALMRAGCHSYVVNSKAIEVANINEITEQVEGGQIEVDEKGYPTGMFRENAMELISRNIPKSSIQKIKNMIIKASNYAVSQGITSVQTDDFMLPNVDFEDVLKAYKELNEINKLPIRVCEQCLFLNIDSLEKFIKLGYKTGQGDNYFKIGPVKLLADGNLGNRTALMSESYSDDNSTKGIAKFTQNELDKLIITAHTNNMNVAVHCIGDKAAYMTFESIEKAQKINRIDNIRHGIVHCQIIDDNLLEKFKNNNVIAYIQPIFLNYDLHVAEKRIGSERVKTSYNWKTMIDAGVNISCSTDCPVEPMDVMPNIYCAVNRKDLSGYPENGWFLNQKLTVEEVVYGYTMGSAYASYEEKIKGSIEEGKLADMAVLSEDIFNIEPNKIKEVKVEMTIVDGKIVYKSE